MSALLLVLLSMQARLGVCEQQQQQQQSPFAKAVIARLQGPLAEVAYYANTSFSVGIADSDGHFGLAAGIEDHASGAALTVENRIPMGSATKLYTAVAVMKLHEAGVIDIDEPICRLVDPWLTRTNGTTLAGLWQNTSINTITARMLMGMRSGLADYDDQKLAAFALDPATWPSDITPYDYLHRWAQKHFLFTPGDGGSYSSIGYVLLGVLAAAATGAPTWDAFDQSAAVVPPPLQASLPGFRFALRGACDSEPGVVRQYRTLASSRESPSWTTIDFQDISPASCLNGWWVVGHVLYQTASRLLNCACCAVLLCMLQLSEFSFEAPLPFQ